MLPSDATTNRALAADPSGLQGLRQATRTGDRASLEAAARAFEALLIGQMLRQMRAASDSLGSGLFESSQSDLYLDLQDQEMARIASQQGEGFGIRQALMRQLSMSLDNNAAPARQLKMPERNLSLRPMQRQTPVVTPATDSTNKTTAITPSATTAPAVINAAATALPAVMTTQSAPPISANDWPPRTAADFVRVLLPQAQAAGQQLGMDPTILLAQSALETGWGRHVPSRSNGGSSYNLFGIKADRRWEGDFISVGTLEFRGGTAQREQARFRAYDSPADSFVDYVNFLKANPRYRGALTATNSAEFIRGLQRAGYATDPSYANKVLGIYGQMQTLIATMQAPLPVAMATAPTDAG